MIFINNLKQSSVVPDDKNYLNVTLYFSEISDWYDFCDITKLYNNPLLLKYDNDTYLDARLPLSVVSFPLQTNITMYFDKLIANAVVSDFKRYFVNE